MDKELKNKILSEIKLSEEEHINRVNIANEYILRIQKRAKDMNIKVEFFIGGSFGKNTYLIGSSDIDVFARFDKEYDDATISELLKSILDSLDIVYKKQKGSRDYYSVEFAELGQNFLLEFVPNRKINDVSEMVNSTDVSPFHVKYLLERLKNNSGLQDEIRLAKRFFKAKGLYGAESYIGGFSGHIIDILIMYFGSLEALIADAKKWREDSFIDINSTYLNRNECLKKIDKSKISKLIVVDSILSDRNAARALSDENYYRFLDVCFSVSELAYNDFVLCKKDLDSDIKDHVNYCVQHDFYGLVYDFKINIDGCSEDIVGSKMLKLSKLIERKFNKFDFKVFERKFLIDLKKRRCLFLYKIENKKVSGIKEITGPYVWMHDAASKFKSLRSDVIIHNNRYYAREVRVVTNVSEISKISIEECEEMLNKDVSFIKVIRLH